MQCVNLRCCTCGQEKSVDINKPITFGFELYDIAKQAGLYPVIDMNYSRTLIFCSKECMEKQLTKGGYIRKRLISVKKEDHYDD